MRQISAMSPRQFISHLRFLRSRPLVAARLAANVFHAFLLKRPRMKNMELAVTYRCNQKCEMCSATTLARKHARVLSVDEIVDLVDQCKLLGLVHVDLTGGEPLLRPWDELVTIVEGLSRNKDIIVAMATNGLLVNADRLARLRQAGLTQILFNIQSADADNHDQIVGVSGSFSRAVSGVVQAKKLGYSVCINTVIGRHNFDDIVRLGEKCKTWGAFLALNLAASAGEWRTEHEHKLTEDWYARYSALLRQPHVRSDNIINFKTFGWGCPGGIEKVYVTEYGEVLQCPFVQVSYGNVRQEPIDRIFRRMSSSHFISKYSERCKHVFSEEFRKEWLDPLDDFPVLPIRYNQHPYLKRKPDCEGE